MDSELIQIQDKYDKYLINQAIIKLIKQYFLGSFRQKYPLLDWSANSKCPFSRKQDQMSIDAIGSVFRLLRT